MKRLLKTLLTASGVLALACSGVAAQTVVVETRSGSTLDIDPPPTYSSGASFTIALTSTTNRINIYSTGGLADIGSTSFSGSTSAGSVDVIIGSGALDTNPLTNLTNAAQNWGGVSFPFSARLSGAIAGNLTGPINPVSIVRLEVHGQVSGAISASATSGTAIGRLQLGSTTSAGTIAAGNGSSGGDIGVIQAESGGTSLAGAISALSGSITTILATGDIDIASGGIQARDGIVEIDAEGDIDADIDADTDDAGDGWIGVVLCDDLAGSLHGAVLSYDGDPGSSYIQITGDVSAVVSFRDTVYGTIDVGGSFIDDGRIEIGGDLVSNMAVTGTLTELIVHGNFAPPAGEIGLVCGDIERIQVDGTIGNNSGSLELPAVTIVSGDGIDEIVAGELYATLRGYVENDYLFDLGTVTIDGNAAISMFTASTFELIDIGGDLEVTSAEEMMLFDAFPAGSYFRIGGNMEIPIFTDAGDFDAQIISGAAGLLSDTWIGPVTYTTGGGPQSFYPVPHYAETTEVSGAGAVGEVPFHLHQTECNPPHSPDGICELVYPIVEWPASHGGELRDTIILSHYGPVFDSADAYGDPDEPETVPLVIYRLSIALCAPNPCPGEEPEWADRTNLFDVYVPGNGSREVWVALKLDEGDPQPIDDQYRYRIELALTDDEPVITQLRSDMTFLPPEDAPNVAGYPYRVLYWCDSFGTLPEE